MGSRAAAADIVRVVQPRSTDAKMVMTSLAAAGARLTAVAGARRRWWLGGML